MTGKCGTAGAQYITAETPQMEAAAGMAGFFFRGAVHTVGRVPTAVGRAESAVSLHSGSADTIELSGRFFTGTAGISEFD